MHRRRHHRPDSRGRPPPEDGPYPDFSTLASRAGINHSVSVGLPLPQRIIGALNMYASTTEPIDQASVGLATSFAGYAAAVVANANASAAFHADTADLAEQMQAAMRSRAVIEQAKGILMTQRRCSASEAFDVLTQLSQSQNRKLRDLAQTIVDGIPAR